MKPATLLVAVLLLAGCAAPGAKPPATSTTPAEPWAPPWSLPKCADQALQMHLPPATVRPLVPAGYTLLGNGLVPVTLFLYECDSAAAAGGAVQPKVALVLLFALIAPPSGETAEHSGYLFDVATDSPAMAATLRAHGFHASAGTLQVTPSPGNLAIAVQGGNYTYQAQGLGYAPDTHGNLQDTNATFYQGDAAAPHVLHSELSYLGSSQLVYPTVGTATGLLAQLAGTQQVASQGGDATLALRLSFD